MQHYLPDFWSVMEKPGFGFMLGLGELFMQGEGIQQADE